MPKLRVGTIYTLYGRRGGAEMLAEKLICGMAEYFDDITFTVYCNDEAFQVLPDNVERLEKCHVPALNNQYTKAIWLETIAAGAVRRDELDLFWIPSGTNSFPGRWSIPTIVQFLDLGEYFIKGKYDFVRTVYRKQICIPASLRRGTLFTTISQTTSRDLKSLFGYDSRVVYPGVSPRTSSIMDEKACDIVKHETKVNLERIIFTPGRTDYIGKGLDTLLQAYAILRKEDGDVPPLVLVGSPGEGHERLIEEIVRLNLQKSVHWLGRVSDECVDALYTMSEFVVFASRYEGFGFPVLEAMQRDVPLICTDAGSLAEVAGDSAYIIPPADPQSLAMAMIKLHRDPALRQMYVAKGKERVNFFKWNVTYENMRKAFDDCRDLTN